MALQKCLKCHQLAMTWGIDEELSPYTFWYCINCDEIIAWEDEKKAKFCSICGVNYGQAMLYMWNDKATFYYCMKCCKKEVIF